MAERFVEHLTPMTPDNKSQYYVEDTVTGKTILSHYLFNRVAMMNFIFECIAEEPTKEHGHPPHKPTRYGGIEDLKDHVHIAPYYGGFTDFPHEDDAPPYGGFTEFPHEDDH